jgi:hypothetical protein
VRLEVGVARVTPFVARDMTSLVHDKLVELKQLAQFRDNRPRAVRCVHPLVTLLEKLDALAKHFPKEREAAAFVRHYEDAARIIAAEPKLPPMADYADVDALVADMLGHSPKQLAGRPRASDPAFALESTPRWTEIIKAHGAIAPMFWGARIELRDACAAIRDWLETRLPQ